MKPPPTDSVCLSHARETVAFGEFSVTVGEREREGGVTKLTPMLPAKKVPTLGFSL